MEKDELDFILPSQKSIDDLAETLKIFKKHCDKYYESLTKLPEGWDTPRDPKAVNKALRDEKLKLLIRNLHGKD